MNRHPPQPLDAEERALAALLPRPHGRVEPGPELDARILAAAREALHPRPAPRRPQRSWIAPTALAASLVLALGLAWQVRPPPAGAPVPAADAVAIAAAPARSVEPERVSDAPVARAFEAVPDAAAARPVAQPPPMATMPAPPREPAPASAGQRASYDRRPEAAAATVAATAPAPPPPPPAPAAPVVMDSPPPAPMAAPKTAESARMTAPAAPALARPAATDTARERASVAGGVAAKAQVRNEAAMAAEAATLDSVVVDDPEQDVPPATMDSPQVREAWLRRIGELLRQGKTAEAQASLDEFRRRYPDAAIPPDLRGLERRPDAPPARQPQE